MMTKNKVAVAVAIVAFLLGGGYWAYQKYGSSGYDSGVACNQQARSCPDGSFVGRVPPSCEFGACPGGETPLPWEEVIDTSTWKIYRNEQYGFEVKYPPSDTTAIPAIIYNINEYKFTGTAQGEKTYPPYDRLNTSERLEQGVISVDYSMSWPDAMPSMGKLRVGIFDKPSTVSLKSWVTQTFPQLNGEYIQAGREMALGSHTAFVVGDYPYPMYEEKMEKKGMSGEIPTIFLLSHGDQYIASFRLYPYNGIFDEIISTFKFTK